MVYKIVEAWKLPADSLRHVSVFLEDVILSSADAVKITGILYKTVTMSRLKRVVSGYKD